MGPGEVLDGRYELVGVLGRGGFGEVWRAFDRRVGRPVAVKMMLAGDGDVRADRGQFGREASAAGNLSHPHIVTVHDFGETSRGGTPVVYLVMELLDGEPLGAVLAREGPLPLERALRWAGQVCDALAAAHGAGLVHRDVKPDNIMVQGSGAVKVVDFGLARSDTAASGTTLTSTDVIVGTPAYMAPERFEGVVGAPGDVYALGCVLTELCTGRRPFDGSLWELIRRHGQEAPPVPSGLRPGLPAELDRLVAGLLAKEPGDRPTAADALTRMRGIARPAPVSYTPTLRDIAAGTGAGAGTGEPSPPAGRPGRPTETARRQPSPPPGAPAAAVGGTSGESGGAAGTPQPPPRPTAAGGKVLWAFTTSGDALVPSVVADGILYARSYRGKVRAVDTATGRKRWTVKTGAVEPPVVADGTLYAGSIGGKVRAVDTATGRVRWTLDTGVKAAGPPVVASGALYLVSREGTVYAVDTATGGTRWTRATDGEVYTRPVVTGGTLYFGDKQGRVHAVDTATGRVRWTLDAGDEVAGLPVVADGILYAGCYEGAVYAVDTATGRVRWTLTAGESVGTPVVVDGILYLGGWDGTVYAVEAATGAVRWTLGDTGGRVAGSPVVVEGGALYTVSRDGKAYGVDTATGKRRWALDIGDQVSSAPVVTQRTLCVHGHTRGAVYGVDTATGRVRWTLAATGSTGPPVVADGILYTASSQTVSAVAV
ncbi:outer membrane protein assembly factor BamB family protein [Streptomyces sp. NPDC004838]